MTVPAAIRRLAISCVLLAGLPAQNERDVGVYLRSDPPPKTAGKVALVFGIDEFSALPRLQCAERDAKDVGDELEACGFTVIRLRMDGKDGVVRPSSRRTVLQEVQRLCRDLREDSTVLFFYSGHGFEDAKGRTYLCPYETDPLALEETALDLDQVHQIMIQSGAKRRVLIADMCRSIPGKAAIDRTLALEKFQTSAGSGFLFSTAPGSKSFEPTVGMKDREGKLIQNGLFTHFFLRGLRGEADLGRCGKNDGFVTFREVAYYVADGLADLGKRHRECEQKPYLRWDGTAEDVLLSVLSDRVAPPVSEPPVSPTPPGRQRAPRNMRGNRPAASEEAAAPRAEPPSPPIDLLPLPDLIREAEDALASLDKDLASVRGQLTEAVAVSEASRFQKNVDDHGRGVAMARTVQRAMSRQPPIHATFETMQAKVRLLSKVPLPGSGRQDFVEADDALLAAVVKGRKDSESRAFLSTLRDAFKDVDPGVVQSITASETSGKGAPVDVAMLRNVLQSVSSCRERLLRLADGGDIDEILRVSRLVAEGQAKAPDFELGPLAWGQNAIQAIYDSGEFRQRIDRLRGVDSRKVRTPFAELERGTDHLVLRAKSYRATLAALRAWVDFASVATAVAPESELASSAVQTIDSVVYDSDITLGGADGRLPWALVLRKSPDPAWVPDPEMRRRIVDTGLPWCVRDKVSGIVMLLVPSGDFMMGSPAHEQGREALENQHARTIRKPFYLSADEVTRQQWANVMGGQGPSADVRSLPVTDISWEDAASFVKRANLMLPSEAQWEYACRAGSKVNYSCGDVLLPEVAVMRPSAGVEAVGRRRRNALGFADMHGNAAEWCADSLAAYPKTGDESAVEAGDTRVLRGGSFRDGPTRCAARSGMKSSFALPSYGFRVARPAP